MAAAFFNLFFVSLRSLFFFFLFFFFFFFYSHSPLQKRVLYGLSKRLIDIVAYHAIIFFSITAKRLLLRRQNVVANIFMQRKIVYFQRYALLPPPQVFWVEIFIRCLWIYPRQFWKYCIHAYMQLKIDWLPLFTFWHFIAFALKLR